MNKNKAVVTIMDYYKQKCFAYLGLLESSQSPSAISEQNIYINNINDISKNKIREYNTWYKGDSDDLLNFYTGGMLYEYNTEPFYDRNKRSYFWCISATEDDIKRTHSGQPRNIIDTIVNLVGAPQVSITDETQQKKLKKILEDNNFEQLFSQNHLPRVLVEGWGCYKIDYNQYLRSTPILRYYRAEDVDFIYKSGQLVAIIFKNYYIDEDNNNYVLFEVRRKERTKDKNGKFHSNLIIEKELYKMLADNTLMKDELKSLKQLSDVQPRLMLNDFDGFLAEPFIIYENDDNVMYGRSMYTGKIDLFDDLDQDLSQAANTVRRSTTRLYMNSNYLERDARTGMPIQPSAYDCKYVLFNGGLGADGSVAGQEPITTVQPRLDFSQYSSHAIETLVQIVSGILSPATLGIDIAKKDNAAAQREKEKVTIFTRKTIIDGCIKVLKKLFSELLFVQSALMDKDNKTVKEYDVSVKFSEFSNDSFESRANMLLGLYNAGVITPDLFIKELYKDTLSEADQKAQVDYINQQKQMQQQQMGMQMSQEQLGAMGAEMGGNNEYDQMMASMSQEG